MLPAARVGIDGRFRGRSHRRLRPTQPKKAMPNGPKPRALDINSLGACSLKSIVFGKLPVWLSGCTLLAWLHSFEVSTSLVSQMGSELGCVHFSIHRLKSMVSPNCLAAAGSWKPPPVPRRQQRAGA